MVVTSNVDIGRMVKKARHKVELNQKEFSEFLNRLEPTALQIQPIDISKYERNIAVPPGDKLLKILNSEKHIDDPETSY